MPKAASRPLARRSCRTLGPMKQVSILLVAVLFIGTAGAQTSQPQAPASGSFSTVESPECATVMCRHARKFRVQRKDGTFIEREIFRPMPIVMGGQLVIVLPDEEIHLAFETGPDNQLIPHAVENPDVPGGTLTFQFTQGPATGESLLKVTNRTKFLLKYNLGIQLPDEELPRETSSCPAPPGLVGYEHWPHTVLHIMARRFQALEPNASMKCE